MTKAWCYACQSEIAYPPAARSKVCYCPFCGSADLNCNADLVKTDPDVCETVIDGLLADVKESE